MHITLTDHLRCPRCGPEYGLTLLAERIDERRVLEGSLGCVNCRERYPIRGGFADLRPPPRAPLEDAPGDSPPPEPGGEEEAERLAALLDIPRPARFVLIAGPRARLAPGLAALVPDTEVVAAEAALAAWPEREGVSRIAGGGALPLSAAGMLAVVVPAEQLDEGARVLAPQGRMIVEGSGEEGGDELADERFAAAGVSVLARKGGVVVGVRGG